MKRKKKVGILTFHRAENYGAILQSFGLYSKLKNIDMEDDIEIIDYRSKVIEKPYKIIYLGNEKNKKLYNFLKSIALLKKNILRKLSFCRFRKKYIKMSEPIYDKLKINNYFDKYNYIITGSDQVWNIDITKNDYNVYLLKNNKEINKVSYAASIGSDEKNNKNIKIVADSIDKYKKISVREETAKNSLKLYTNKDIAVCLDPVLLHNSNFWNTIRKKSNIKQEYIFVYTTSTDYNMIKYADEIAQKESLLIVHLDKINRYKSKSKSMYHCGPELFVDLIANSKYILTNSFHGLAFSIIYQKKFIVFPVKKRNSRIENLIKLCNLENRVYDKYKEINIKENINYTIAMKHLEKEIEKSVRFLKDALDLENK